VSTLLLRLDGPLQSWGIGSRHGQRDTGLEPSKSGVIGLICAALGRPRSQPVDDLAALRMAVRVDHPGEVRTDYHTAGAGGFRRADDSTERHNVILSRRVYLCDASFLVGLEGDRESLQEIDAALARPRWPLFLGRKACVPSAPVRMPDGLSDAPLLQALIHAAWPKRPIGQRLNELRVVEEIPLAEATAIVPDQPVGAAFLERTFGPRGIAIRMLPVPS
jgi:CRISPR system Cascade subunit CasD